jgi:hypothetical protein
MIKKKIFYILLFLISCYSTKLYPNINIVLKIENEIITNRDIQKEIGYLKILNPNLKQLNNNQILIIAKDSLINQEIKKKEINKFLKNASKEK